MNIAIIPARGGSKRIPRKNIKQFFGKPMIAWPIEAALQSGCFNEVIVSTDDDEIAKIAIQYGASVPFRRPAELSDDHAGTTEVVKHAAQWLMQHHEAEPVNICCIYPTAPLLQVEDLQRGLSTLGVEKCSFTFSATSYAFPIQRAIRITKNGRVQMFNSAYFDVRSQDLEPAYHDAGQFYWGTLQAWLKQTTMFSEHAAPIVLPRHRVVDIDTLEDWALAEILFKANQVSIDR